MNLASDSSVCVRACAVVSLVPGVVFQRPGPGLRSVEHFTAKAGARARVSRWIEDYNQNRRHSALGMMSPIDYEQALHAGKAA